MIKESEAKDLVANLCDYADLALSQILWMMHDTTTAKFINKDATKPLDFQSVSWFNQDFYQRIKQRLILITTAPNGVDIGTAESSGYNYNYHITIKFRTDLAARNFIEKFNPEFLYNINGMVLKLTKHDVSYTEENKCFVQSLVL